jgi:tRNA-dihydrouridine synthase
MKFYYAPMEGITGYLYRNAYDTFFPNIDKYFSPFIVTNQYGNFKTREITDILPENNQEMVLIPQLLSNNAKDFINTVKKIKELGYEEINLNLGCPSRTVVSKYKGSGFLAKTKELDAFFEEIFSEQVTKISVKTRIGKEDPEEFYELLEIYNKYPLEELIIHPRIQTDFYKNKPNLNIFGEALATSKNPVCYNGDIFTKKDYIDFMEQFPSVDTMMLGRGLLSNPALINQICKNEFVDKDTLRAFHDKVYESYQGLLFGDRNVLFKMKEFWFYLITMFSNPEKYAKKIRKSERLSDYEEAVSSLFREQNLVEK